MGLDALRHRHPDLAQRLLRVARSEDLPARQCLLDLPSLPHWARVLPELREQRTRTLTLIDNAKSCGHSRMTEMNQQVADNLDRMIGEMEDGQETENAG